MPRSRHSNGAAVGRVSRPALTGCAGRRPRDHDGLGVGSVPVAVERTVVTAEEGSSQTLAIVFSASALMIALLSAGFVAVARRPRPRWTAP